MAGEQRVPCARMLGQLYTGANDKHTEVECRQLDSSQATSSMQWAALPY